MFLLCSEQIRGARHVSDVRLHRHQLLAGAARPTEGEPEAGLQASGHHPTAIAFARSIPLLLFARAVTPGFPSPADDFIKEAIDLHSLLIRNRSATFLFRVAGDSMVGKGLFDGDLAVVDRSLKPQRGDIVVVDVDGERSFKVWGQRAGRVLLSFANPRYPAFEVDSEAVVEVWGVVSGSLNPRRRAVRG